MKYIPQALFVAAFVASSAMMFLPVFALGDDEALPRNPDAASSVSTAPRCGSVTLEVPGGERFVADAGMCNVCVVRCAQGAERLLEDTFATLGTVDDDSGAPIMQAAVDCARRCSATP